MTLSRRAFLSAVAAILGLPAPEAAESAEIDKLSPSYDDLIRYAGEFRPPLDYYAE